MTDLGDARQGGHLQSIALVRRTVLDAVQEYQRVAVLDGFHVDVGDARCFLGEPGELEIMGGEEREGTDLVGR